ncbi:MAG: J domain-containing protein [Rickettsiales bacterium]|jgi:hypothetical protein|nr:J domain-containing protein [Rickettsiales bacterium]
MIKKCDHKNCDKAGVCRAPKSRDLCDYYYFCKEHAAEYNKNWNYYNGMTDDEIADDWERETFGIADRDRAAADKKNAEYAAFINDFLTGRATFDKQTTNKAMPSKISAALKILNLPPTASKRDVAAKYRQLAKIYHPDTATNKKTSADEFTKITGAYNELKIWFDKK